MKEHLTTGLLGTALGLSLSLIGFADWGEVHAMFLFTDLRMFLAFASAVVVSVIGFRILCGLGCFTPQPFHKGIVPGSILFGAGWALSGACPAIGLVQLGEGQLPALASIAGILLGAACYRGLHGRVFKWSRGGCGV